jgi:hypothetical protein
MKYEIIFIIEILAFISISFWAALMEGPTGGIFGIRAFNFLGFAMNADFFIFNIMVPLFLLIPFIMIGPDIKLFGTLASGYCVGMVLEDFFWFVVNPYYGVQKFNSEYATWLIHWIKIGDFEIPLFYIRYLIGALLLWFIFVYNSEKVSKLIKKYLKIK